MEKVIAITGANSGIGRAAAEILADKNTKNTILLLCRDEEKGTKARNEIIENTGNSEVYLYLVDLDDFDSIQTASKRISQDWDRIDVLANNAGIILREKELNKHGIERTFTINHLGHFLLTDLLYPVLATDARVINTSSGAHRSGELNLEDINYEKSKYTTFGSYGRSKLANILYTKKLDRVFTTRSSFAFHPGFVGSNFGKNNGLLAKVAMTLLRPFAKSPKSGAQPLVYLTSEDNIEKNSGKYFVDTNWIPFRSPDIKPKTTKRSSYDEQLQDELWEESEQLIKSWDPDFEMNIN